jgi:predicted component of type VI protein secretion system
MPRLIVRSTETGAVIHELTDDVVTVGRASDNTIQIDDPSVSGRHAQLQRIGGIYRLKDLDSGNGTRVNGDKINEIALAVGDRLRFGQVEAYFEADQAGAAEPLPELAAIEAKPAESRARPADFANASPFPHRKKDKDLIRLVVLAVAAVALLAFFGSMIAVLLMRAPI